jgi:hypothetical protein
MLVNMASAILAQTLDALSIALREPLVAICDKVKSRVEEGELEMPSDSTVISTVKRLRHPADAVEEAVRQAKLREAVRLKESLQSKLGHVETSIEVLASQAQRVQAKPQKETVDQSPVTQAEIEEMLSRLQKEKQHRHQKLHKLHELEQAKLLAEDEAEAARQRELELEVQLLRKQKLDNKQLKRLALIEERKLLKQLQEEETKQALQAVPLHQKLEEKYQREVLMPKLEQHKALLASKRAKLTPLNKEELADHARRYREVTKEAEARRERLMKNMQTEGQVRSITGLGRSRLDSERLSAAKDDLKYERGKMAEKRKRYAELVKELFPPKVRALKDMPSVHSQSLSVKRTRDLTSGQPSSTPQPMLKLKRKQPKSAAVVAEVQTTQPKVDYLADLRALRERQGKEIGALRLDWSFQEELEDSSLSSYEKYQKVTAKISAFERKAKRIGQVTKGQTAKDALNLEVELSNGMISAVKAKLALLEAQAE